MAHAAAHADIIAPTMLGRTLSDGQRHEVRWEASRLDEVIAEIRHAAAARGRSVTFHALVQAVVVTKERRRAAEDIARRQRMLLSDVLATPFLCLGTHDEIAAHLLTCAQRWGISYYTVRNLEDFVPVLARVPLD